MIVEKRANKPSLSEAYELFFEKYPDVLDTMMLSEILSISTQTVYKLLAKKEIRGFKVGHTYRIPKVFVMLYLEMVQVNEDFPK